MNQKVAWQDFVNLPPEAQQQVIDFIAFLQQRYASSRARKASRPSKLAKEPFVGMWRDREDLQDRKSTRLNSSHGYISYAVFCLKKNTKITGGRTITRLTHTSCSRMMCNAAC